MSTPEIITVNSEALEAQIRELLPSQRGFGSELQASNVILPIIDLTAAAEGSLLPVSMQQAIAFSNNTAFSVVGTSNTVIETGTGWFRLVGTATCTRQDSGAATTTVSLIINDGSTSKNVWLFQIPATNSNDLANTINFDFVVFLRAQDELRSTCAALCAFQGSIRQIATINGTLVDPVGYTSE